MSTNSEGPTEIQPETELDEWGDPIEDGDTVICLVSDPGAPLGLRPVLKVKGSEVEPGAKASDAAERQSRD